MSNILIFGNSGSGKSTLAKELCSPGILAHLDLDTLAWKPVSPPERMPLEESAKKIDEFLSSRKSVRVINSSITRLERASSSITIQFILLVLIFPKIENF